MPNASKRLEPRNMRNNADSVIAPAFLIAVALVGLLCACSSSAAKTGAPPPASSSVAAPQSRPPSPELLAKASKQQASGVPSHEAQPEGLDVGEVGIQECDACVRLATACATGKAVAAERTQLLAEVKQRRIGWKAAALKAGPDPAEREAIAAECRAAAVATQLRTQQLGCEPKGARGR